MESVSLIRCSEYEYETVRERVRLLLEPLGGMAAFVSPGERVLIKPNLLSAKDPSAAVTTHPVLVRVVAEMARAIGCRVMIGDSPGIGSFRRVAQRSGIAAAAVESGAELVEFSETVDVNGIGLFRRITLARPYWEADKIINLPKLKTHEMMTMTCAVKNLFGAVVGTEKAGWHLKAGTSQERFARLLLEIYLLKPPVLTIVDGVVAMEGNGPASGDPIALGALIAGGNGVAVDVVAARLTGIPSDLLHVEREAVRMGLAGAHPKEVHVFGAALSEFAQRPFRLPSGLDVQFGLPGFIKNSLKAHLMARPEADPGRCVLCGVCRDACPPAAIRIENSALTVDQRRCIRCWCCRELCPHDAMRVKRGMLLRMLSAVRRPRTSGV